MAALLARVARGKARLRVVGSFQLRPKTLSAHIGVSSSQSVVWRRVGVETTDLQTYYFSTTRDADYDGNDDAKAQRVQAFNSRMDSLGVWIHELGERQAFHAMLRVVYECYRPLYDRHHALRGVTCSLMERYADAEAVVKEKMRYRTNVYNDQVTWRLESKVVLQFNMHKRPDLVIAVHEHRKEMAKKLGTVTNRRYGTVTRFTNVSDNFQLQVMEAYRALGKDAEAMSVYQCALESDRKPTAEMTGVFFQSLRALENYDAVWDLYEAVKRDDRPVDMYFYRSMLYCASRFHKSAVVREVLKEMKARQMPVRSKEYMLAMRSLDDLVVKERPYIGKCYRYPEYLALAANQDASPEAFKQTYEACREVLDLYHEMVDVNKILPAHKGFFTRVFEAAIVLREYERVAEYAAQAEQLTGRPVVDAAALKLVVIAFLLRNKPQAAWEYVLKASDALDETERTRAVAMALTSIFEYLQADQQTHANLDLTVQFLDALKAKQRLTLFDHALSRRLKRTVVFDAERVSDAQVLAMIRDYSDAFIIGNSFSYLTAFAEAGRWSLINQVLNTTDARPIPWLSRKSMVKLSGLAIRDEQSLERMELVLELVRAIDLPSMFQPSTITVCSHAARAVKALRENHGEAGELVIQTHSSAIRRQLQQLGVEKPKVVELLPQEVREIFM